MMKRWVAIPFEQAVKEVVEGASRNVCDGHG